MGGGRAIRHDPELGRVGTAIEAGYAAMATGFVSDSGLDQVDDLFSRGGMASMLTTIWLVLGALSYAAVMEHAGFLQRLLEPIVRRTRRRGSLIAAVTSSGVGLNVIAGDQYVADVLPARMFRGEFARRGLAPQVLSRAVEDSGTVTSVLVPWNTCGAYISGVLGVSTAAYLPFCFFNLLSPLLDILYGFIGFKVPQATEDWEDERHIATTAENHLRRRRCPNPRAKTAVEPRRRFTLPSAYTILFGLIVVMALATWLIPAGTYALDKEGAPVPGTYKTVDSHPARILTDSLTAPINGLYGIEDDKGNISYYNSGELFGAIDVALFIIVIGGFLGVTMRTGAIQSGIGRLVTRLRGRERWMIPILMIVFALGGSTYGMAEESLAFYSLVIAVMIAAGYDALTGAAVVLLGCGIGTYGSTINPFATGIASGFAGTSISEGLILRLGCWSSGSRIGIFFVLRYADRVKKDPSSSVVADRREANEAHFTAERRICCGGVMTGQHKAILACSGWPSA